MSLALIRRAHGLCPRCGVPTSALSWCLGCRLRRSRAHAARVDAQTMAPGPNQIAHCGEWHLATTLPFTCPTCGQTYGDADASHD